MKLLKRFARVTNFSWNYTNPSYSFSFSFSHHAFPLIASFLCLFMRYYPLPYAIYPISPKNPNLSPFIDALPLPLPSRRDASSVWICNGSQFWLLWSLICQPCQPTRLDLHHCLQPPHTPSLPLALLASLHAPACGVHMPPLPCHLRFWCCWFWG
jgi:hypothetical protein